MNIKVGYMHVLFCQDILFNITLYKGALKNDVIFSSTCLFVIRWCREHEPRKQVQPIGIYTYGICLP